VKAFVLTSFDHAPEFADVPEPEPGPGEVRVRVHATSVNPVDHMIRSGFFRAVQEYRFPAVFGRDFAGVVQTVGDGVTRLREGDEVYGFVKRDYIGDGTFADYVVVPGGFFVAAKPSRLSLQQAGTLAQAGITALECVEAVPSGPGQVVVVNGATGGLGTFAVQIAKARGADVVATAPSCSGRWGRTISSTRRKVTWSSSCGRPFPRASTGSSTSSSMSTRPSWGKARTTLAASSPACATGSFAGEAEPRP